MTAERILKQGIRCLQEGDLEAAQGIFDALIQEHPTDGSAYLWQGNCYVLIGDLKKARQAFRAVLKHGDEELRQEAQRQLRSLWYNRFVYHLILQPPLRYLLLLALLGYVVSLGLAQLPGAKQIAQTVGWISIWGVLPFFFVWVIFIFAYFVGNIAFAPGAQDGDVGVRSARLAIALAGIFVIPANIFMSVGIGVRILAVFLDIFLLSLMLSQVINRLGRRLAGEESALIVHQLTRAGVSSPETKSNES